MTGLGDLPRELVDKIVRHIDQAQEEDEKQEQDRQHDKKRPIDNLLLVSRCFQLAVEDYTGRWRSALICQGQGNQYLQSFVDYYSRHRRATHLEHIVCELVIPETLDASVEAQIFRLFHAISILETLPDEVSRLESVELEVRSSTDMCYGLWHLSRQQMLLNPRRQVPQLRSVKCFRLGHSDLDTVHQLSCPEALDPASLALLLPVFPNLESLNASYLHDDLCAEGQTESGGTAFLEVFQGPRKDSRHGFNNGIRTAIQHGQVPARLSELKLNFGHAIKGRQQDQTRTLPNLVHPRKHDPLSSSLRLFSLSTTNLRKLTLSGCFDWTLLAPPSPSDSPGARCVWPSLEDLQVVFYPEAPDGSWYFQRQGQRPPEDGQDTKGYDVNMEHWPLYWRQEVSATPILSGNGLATTERSCDRARPTRLRTQHLFRMAPVDSKVNLVLEAFAMACFRMPRLRKSALWFPLQLVSEDDFHDLGSSRDEYNSAWGVTWMLRSRISDALWITQGWKPSPRVHSLLRTAWARHGLPVDEEWAEFLDDLKSLDGGAVEWPA
ncbi:hypothetical protein MKZ38_001022 [Zalerion maritima]|uniref:Uncharacterized protein n=1 Tax=Zalerion maritima TaxID=339359 RepID=A0AAD5WS80_9PEZI|nr:hypothetical protein MKZ38_001022 [Zalerion maritima]